VLNSSQITTLIGYLRQASDILLSHYRNPQLSITTKEDQSPVTAADMASHRFLAGALERDFPGIPLISEEASNPDYSIRKNWEYAWILDPLDGTREFIAENDEFAINLALLHHHTPVFGIIAIPAKNTIYYALRGSGSWKIGPGNLKQQLPLYHSDHEKTRKITALISRSHSGEREKIFVNTLKEKGWDVEIRPAGSSYKHVLLAEGSAHLYAKPGICSEWDTAPGQVILQEAGGSVVRMDDGLPLQYNKEHFINPDLIMWAPGVSIPL
jgi:3'(2'), 5'-bisphosphate nucleotidase